MLPDYDQLLSIYHRACRIVGEDPDDFDIGNRLEFMIRNGRSICEVIEFLEDELQKLEYQLVYLELKQFDYFGEQDALTYRIAMNNPESHKQDLEREISTLMESIKEARQKIINQYNQNKNERKLSPASKK
jgi:predicted  nucleic acid-binding Zn-ribbon protein